MIIFFLNFWFNIWKIFFNIHIKITIFNFVNQYFNFVEFKSFDKNIIN